MQEFAKTFSDFFVRVFAKTSKNSSYSSKYCLLVYFSSQSDFSSSSNIVRFRPFSFQKHIFHIHKVEENFFAFFC